MKKTSPLNYAFSIGKCRVLERFLIRQEVFEEAIELGLVEALKLFVESDLYSEELLHIKDSAQLETVLHKEWLKLKSIIRSLILDKKLLALLELDNLTLALEIVSAYGSAFLRDYLRHLIDMHNIKTYLRLFHLKEPQEKLDISLVSGGFIKREDFFKLYAQGIAVFLMRLEYVHKQSQIIDYAYYLKEAIQRLEKENSFIALEKAINDFLMLTLQPAKYISFGPEPVLAYYFAKVNELNLMRMVILAKFNHLSNDLLKERLNAVYA